MRLTNNMKLERFKGVWNQKGLHEDVKEILAASLYVLNGSNAESKENHSSAKFPLTEEKLRLLSLLAKYSQNA